MNRFTAQQNIIRLTILLAVALFFPRSAAAQQEIYYYDAGYGLIDKEANAKYKREVKGNPEAKVKIFTYELIDNEWVKQQRIKAKREDDRQWVIRRPGERLFPDRIIRTYTAAGDGLYHYRDSLSGNAISQHGTATQMMPLHKEDSVFTYYRNGQLKSAALYHNNSLVGSKNWLNNGQRYYDDIHYYVDQEPEHTMGQAVFRASIMGAFKEAKIDLSQLQGYTEIGWVVLPDGTATGFHSSGSKLGAVNQVIIRAIQGLPGEWIPARLNGKAVPYHMVLPFNFRDQSENFDQVELSGGFLSWD